MSEKSEYVVMLQNRAVTEICRCLTTVCVANGFNISGKLHIYGVECIQLHTKQLLCCSVICQFMFNECVHSSCHLYSIRRGESA